MLPLTLGLIALLALTYAPAIAAPTWYIARLRSASRSKLVLTYDDGPSAACPTPQILEVLRKHRAKATFFQLGRNIAEAPVVSDRVIAEGHEIAAHSFHHFHAWKKPVHAVQDLVCGLRSVARWTVQSRRPLYRPPYGKCNLWTLLTGACLGAQPVWWTVDSRDTWPQLPDPEVILQQLDRENGGVVLMHDFPREPNSERARYTVELTEKLLLLASQRGWTVCTASEMLGNKT